MAHCSPPKDTKHLAGQITRGAYAEGYQLVNQLDRMTGGATQPLVALRRGTRSFTSAVSAGGLGLAVNDATVGYQVQLSAGACRVAPASSSHAASVVISRANFRPQMSSTASRMCGQIVVVPSVSAVTRYSRVVALSSVQFTQMSARMPAIIR